jgi:hypothetical protein
MKRLSLLILSEGFLFAAALLMRFSKRTLYIFPFSMKDYRTALSQMAIIAGGMIFGFFIF